MNSRLTIAMDGPAGSGKSTVARRVAEKLDYLYLNSGAMYRAMTLLSIQEEVPSIEVPRLVRLAQICRIDFTDNGRVTLLNGVDVSEKIRTPEIDRGVSAIAEIPEIRHEIVKQQRRIGESGGIVTEGRDVTTVVFPNADLKFYLDASVEERARRRFIELKSKNIKCTIEQIEADIRSRDKADLTRAHSPLKIADDAIVVDTTSNTIDEVVDFILEWIQARSRICEG